MDKGTYTYDRQKDLLNQDKHGLELAAAAEFDWSTALIREDTRRDYGESRFIGLGYIENRLHVIVFTPRKNGYRVISLRRANKREQKRYDQAED